ncbi:nucleoside triphosphate pyrophosphohydrolase [Gammaproteobacteria bacterium 45_16_T64]|nr:nucleoside triphosphate pyrophosphohydrolase [Gammaproteobacteria bacterium 45_16_T64]
MERVEYLMARLRDKDSGCPWDIKQTYQSIVPYTIEETYEVVDAIEKGDLPHLQEELGDLLFQVIFYAQIAKEEGHFSLDDVASGLVTKLVRRHPHVFPEGTLESRVDIHSRPSEEYIRGQWDKIKAEEKRLKSLGGKSEASASILDDIPVSMAPLLRAQKLQKKVSKKGFDWPSIDLVLDKLQEEVDELKEELAVPAAEIDLDAVADEIGDVLFSTVNVARFSKLDAELIMKKANDKFQRRFQGVEAFLEMQGESLDSADLERMEQGWQHVKQHEANT